MTREIKFRAWDYTHQKMNFDVVPIKSRQSVLYITYTISDGKVELFDIYAEPNHSDVMQFTGLKNQDDIEIYEGDLLQMYPNGLEFRYIWKVVWDKEYLQFRCISIEGESNYPLKDFSTYKIIGNIYENPELK